MSQQRTTNTNSEIAVLPRRRKATVYDVVADRVGRNGFLTNQKTAGSTKSVTPDEVLMRQTGFSESEFNQIYGTKHDLDGADHDLPNSDLLKAIHTYTSDFYSTTTAEHGAHDFGSMDGTALIAVGCLLEEAMRTVLGENGDMALVEPRSLSNGLPESRLTRHQIRGRVRPPPTPPPVEESESERDDKRLLKKRRR